VRLDIEYEGTRYSGWQVQRNARTVQGEIMAAASTVFGRPEVELQGAGRTDAGVHALRQVAHIDAPLGVSPHSWRHKINDLLPPDIHVLRAEPVPLTFHARHDAVSRTYLYQISRRRTAFGKRFVWWVKDPLRVEVMRSLAAQFVGLHDFASFCDKGHVGDTRVKVDEVAVEEHESLVLVRLTASHFLWKMVRQMVGVLVEVGRGRMSAREAARLLESPSGRPAELTAPPSGLFLERVRYAGETALAPLRPQIWVP